MVDNNINTTNTNKDLFINSNKTSSNSISNQNILKFKFNTEQFYKNSETNLEENKNPEKKTILILNENNIISDFNKEDINKFICSKINKKTVKFKDQFNNNKKYSLFEKRHYLVEIIEVESYKKYNKIESKDDKVKNFFKNNSCGSVICNIF
jgi:hypothetical protein